MNKEQQRIAILKAMGWTETEPWLDGRRCFERADSNSGWNFDDLPDYLNDLNAMHEACVLYDRVNFVIEYERELHKVLLRDEKHICEAGPFYWLATAAQRAEAFLKTIGKWEGGSDGKNT